MTDSPEPSIQVTKIIFSPKSSFPLLFILLPVCFTDCGTPQVRFSFTPYICFIVVIKYCSQTGSFAKGEKKTPSFAALQTHSVSHTVHKLTVTSFVHIWHYIIWQWWHRNMYSILYGQFQGNAILSLFLFLCVFVCVCVCVCVCVIFALFFLSFFFLMARY